MFSHRNSSHIHVTDTDLYSTGEYRNTATIRLYKDGNYKCMAINRYGTGMKELQVNFKSKRFSGLISPFLSNIIQCFRVSPT